MYALVFMICGLGADGAWDGCTLEVIETPALTMEICRIAEGSLTKEFNDYPYLTTECVYIERKD